MASIFTYETEPHRVSSPWLNGSRALDSEASSDTATDERATTDISLLCLQDDATTGGRLTRLQAEPQEGPVEYKLHLLLRPRRRFRSTSTGNHISGSKHSKFGMLAVARSLHEEAFEPIPSSGSATPPSASTQQTRQHRLEQLTTQLLWRLQQSSPYHTSSATNIILPSLPEALPALQAPQQPTRLPHGLEESQGALYEIGVSDDGTLVGLAEDEMLESLNNLRAMAACLGCTVEVLRKEVVGECEWLEVTIVGKRERQIRRTGDLVVAEAWVKPLLPTNSPSLPSQNVVRFGSDANAKLTTTITTPPTTEQLRVTLTGPTMSGKSSLLGTLTTSTLDNGRGKSRLSMLKHRHEITSGITSSVTQELLGYQNGSVGDIEIVNFATENVASWIDIHAATVGNRLAFISDSAGHPRYRRTTLRGLVGWAPHWTLLCISADDTNDTADKGGMTNAPQSSLGTAAVPDMDLSGAQLNLCLRLQHPLVIVITKLDLASRTGLRECLTKVLDTLKANGKTPAIVPNKPGVVTEEDLQSVKAAVVELTRSTAIPLLDSSLDTVPIVLTSAVDGTGIANLHALLHELPVPAIDLASRLGNSLVVFDVEDVYSKAAEFDGVIVSGRLRLGQLTLGDIMVVGPFPGQDQNDDSDENNDRAPWRASAHLPTSRSFPGALPALHTSQPLSHLTGPEWREVQITSLRNLRLPVHSLHCDQVATIGISLHDKNAKASQLSRIRKGMVLTTTQPRAVRTFSARFDRNDLASLAIGNQVVVYISSVRASARVVSARTPDSPVGVQDSELLDCSGDGPFSFEESDAYANGQPVAGVVTDAELLVTFTFEVSKEFIMVGDRILVVPGGGPGLHDGKERGQRGIAGLHGFVGHITEISG